MSRIHIHFPWFRSRENIPSFPLLTAPHEAATLADRTTVRNAPGTKEHVSDGEIADGWRGPNNRKQVAVEAGQSNKNAQDMYMITTAPSLFLGLGARIFINKFVYHYDSSTIPDYVFLGLWQGTALYYLLMRQVEFAWAASVGILGRLLIDFAQTWDTSRCACTLLGVALGVLFTDIASQFLEDDEGRPAIFGGTAGSPGLEHHHHHRKKPSRRLVQFSRSNSLVEPARDKGKEVARDAGRDRERERGRRDRHKDAKLEDFKKMRDWESRSIITADSITSSDLIHPKTKMTPLQREVANLRAKASLADTERRRFKEEKKWALSQGNAARAEQMGWQVKRYAALVDSFHKEADAKLLEGAIPSFSFAAIGILALFVISIWTQAVRTVQIVPCTHPTNSNQSLYRYCPTRPRTHGRQRRIPSQATQRLRPQTLRPSIRQRVGSAGTSMTNMNSRRTQVARSWSKY